MTAREIVEAALAIDPAHRAAHVIQECGADRRLLHEVNALLAAYTAATASVAVGVSAIGTGSDIGPYKLIRQLGEGGMGVVYHAHQTHPLRRDVALKVIKPGMDSRQVIARFESERQALALMDHPNIARVFDAGTTPEGRPYFAMELVDGVPITRYCNDKRMSVERRIALFLPVCQAIQHAHQKGIIHRDIKPSNVLVTEREGTPVPKVIDFGLAKALGQQLSDASMMTNLGVVVGTLEYMSPEQAEVTRQDVDTRTDVYSLGAVLYELLTGATPLPPNDGEAAGYVDVLKRIREEEPVRPSVRVRGLGNSSTIAAERQIDVTRLSRLLQGELTWIVMKALEKDRVHRYETVNALARDLERYLVSDPVEAGPPSTTYRLRKFARRHRVGLAMAATITILLVAGVVVSTWMAVRASRAEAEARAVNDFLRDDVLAQAGARTQARAGAKSDPDLKVRTALERAATRIEGKFTDQPLVEASIRNTIGLTFEDLGLYPEAQAQFEKALELRTRVLGDAHTDTLETASLLGNIYTYEGKYAQAEPILEKTSALARRSLGESHETTISVLNNLALTYKNRGKYALAEPLYTKIVESRRQALDEGETDALTSANNLAMLYNAQSKYTQAEPLLARLVDISRGKLGQDHPVTLTVMNNLALTYFSMGQSTRAEPLWTDVLANIRRVLGNEHPNTLTTMGNLAMVYRVEGKYAEAEPLLVDAMAVGTRVQGEQHPNTLLTMSKLADLYRDQRKYAQAEALYDTVVARSRRALGDQHPETLTNRVDLGVVLLLQGKHSVAEATLRETLEAYEKTAPDTWNRYYCQSLLGESLAGQKRFMEAEPLLLSGYAGMAERRSSQSASGLEKFTQVGNRIVAFYRDWGKPDKATEWQQKLTPAAVR
jgi:non-specific serine/threonine protein kinase/serine/threonine-protein kinase